MSSYKNFAYIYDKLTYDVDYNLFFKYIKEIFDKNNVKPELILDLACGTGNMTKNLSDAGYDVIGIDNSLEMLNVAKEKCENVLFLEQDMTEFELYGTVDVILCLLDSINYITDKRKLLRMFKLVKNYLNNGGLFIFDINSPYKLEKILGNNTFVQDMDDVYYVWENEKIKDKVNFYLSFFVKEGDKYERFDEVHTERIYDAHFLSELLAEAGLEHMATYGDFTFKKPTGNSQRIFIIAKK